MMASKSTLVLLTILFGTSAFGQKLSKADQIASAIQAAPSEMRDGATVLGFDENGALTTLKDGSNDLICLADDPNRSGFNAACYHKDLDPFMARGRALRAEGKNPDEIFKMREEEAKSGKLQMPEKATTLHILSGKDGKYNSSTGEVDGASYRYVVYIPFATSQTTGLPTRPTAPGHPWIMDPGTHRAHIMITPPRPK